MSSNPRRTADRLAPAPSLRQENATVGASRAPGDGPADPAPGAPTITLQPALAHTAGLSTSLTLLLADRGRRQEDAVPRDGRIICEDWQDGRGARGETYTGTTGSISERETVGMAGAADMSPGAHPAVGGPARDQIAQTPRQTATGSLYLKPPSVVGPSAIENLRARLPTGGDGPPQGGKR